mmetsp:Transcript_130016/g.225981  ORF Transcript_130016/g.225981 Transcript_130016/m.225981 type:complete len:390 (-) Transcript_130016:43-1212(-)
MVGYDLEDKAYCMELTFNYGLDSYEPGTGLLEFGIYVPDVDAAKAAAEKLSYKVEDGVVVGPDSYRFRLFKMPEGRSERFLYTAQRTSNLEKCVAFYKDYLGMSDAAVPSGTTFPGKAAAVSYTTESHPHKLEPVILVFYEDGIAPKITPWEGRHAFTLPAEKIHSIYAKYKSEMPDKIMHDADGKPIMFEEVLGTLSIFIARDADGYELCLVSRETMLPLAVQAVQGYDGKALNWEERDKRISLINDAGKKVEELLAKNAVVLFSEEWCPFSKKAKEAFASIEADVFVFEMKDNEKKELVTPSPTSFLEYIAAKTNSGESVPKAFIKGEFVGGGDDVVALKKSGLLLSKCVAAGAARMPEMVEAAATDRHFFVNGKAQSQEAFDAAKL